MTPRDLSFKSLLLEYFSATFQSQYQESDGNFRLENLKDQENLIRKLYIYYHLGLFSGPGALVTSKTDDASK